LFYYYKNNGGLAVNKSRLRLVIVTSTPYLLALAVNLVCLVLLRDRMPDRLAGHFDLAGHVDGSMSRPAAALTSILVLGGLAAVAGHVASRGRFSARGILRLVVGAWGTAAFLGYLLTAILFANRGATEGSTVRFPTWNLAVALGAALIATAVGFALSMLVADAGGDAAPEEERPRLDLAEGEVASWTRRVGSGVLFGVGLMMLYVAVVLVAVTRAWNTGVPLFAVGLLVLIVGSAQVSVDRRGLTVHASLAAWPRIRIPLRHIEAASSREVNALTDFGGWGYRIRPGIAGIVLRSGEAVVLRRTNGTEFAVTVSDAATAAALLKTLVDRRGRR
jgi:hypothetical protein